MTGLVKKIDERMATAGKYPRHLGVYVLFVNNSGGLDNQLRAIAEREKLKHVSLCIGAPPRNYEVSGEADVTVVIYNPDRRGRQSVRANFALRKGELDVEKTCAIVQALGGVLPR